MFVRTVDQLTGTDKEGKWQNGDLWLRAARLVTKSDPRRLLPRRRPAFCRMGDRLPLQAPHRGQLHHLRQRDANGICHRQKLGCGPGGLVCGRAER